MSRAYRIRVKEQLNREIIGTDEVCSELELLDILPAEGMRGLLRDELERRGFQESDGKQTRNKDGVHIEIDVATGEVKVRAEAKEEAKLEAEQEGMGFDDFGPNEETLSQKIREDLKKDLEKKLEKRQERLREDATEQLEKQLGQVREELDSVVNAVTRSALKEKAKSLGSVREVQENEQTGELKITIEV